MRNKKTSKKQEIKEEPQKPFEEFAIDPKILEELDNIPDKIMETNNTEENYYTDENGKIEVVENQQQIINAASSEFINIVRENIDYCTKEIKDISDTMNTIETQKNTEAFWKKSENIKTISKYVNKMSDIQQKTLDLLVMFLGASGKMADDYDTILKTIDELGELNGGETEVLNYLLKVKRMIKEIKNNDERLKAIIFDNEQLKKKVEQLENNYNEKTTTYEKNSKIVVSKMNRINRRLNRQSLAVLISYILTIIIGVILYIKVF